MVPIIEMKAKQHPGATCVLVDSKQICDILEEKFPSSAFSHSGPKRNGATSDSVDEKLPGTPGRPVSEEDWRRWTRDVFVRVVVVNMNRSFRDAWDSFAYVDAMNLTESRKVMSVLYAMR